MVNLSDNVPGCDNFKWREVLWLDGVGACAMPEDQLIIDNLIHITQQLQTIRHIFNKPIIVTSGWRPMRYNKAIGGAPKSQHMLGKGLDFKVKHYDCDIVRKQLVKYLDELDIRMEQKIGAKWIHIDSKDVEPGGRRYFIP